MDLTAKYTIEDYRKDIDEYGLSYVWNTILHSIDNPQKEYGVIKLSDFGDLYELGLAHVDKQKKKEHGQYFTPKDVASVMCDYFTDLKGENICDVCCGVGNLILTFLEKLSYQDARDLLLNGHVYLYELDKLALQICVHSLKVLYNLDDTSCIHSYVGDFLDNKVKLPDNCKVISNPPYFRISEVPETWTNTKVLERTKEFYAVMFEKIIENSEASVIISPYSFISGTKFYSLREVLNEHNGFILSFDNIPGNIFNSKRQDIFTTTKVISVRAAITVTANDGEYEGYKCSGFIRFKNIERDKLLRVSTLNKFIGDNAQIVNKKSQVYYKVFPELEELFGLWIENSQPMKEFVSSDGEYRLCIAGSRYFVSVTPNDLNRVSKHYLYFNSKDERDFAYSILNSSFCYWYWRILDGGITFSKTLLNELPVNNNFVSKRSELVMLAKEMQNAESQYIQQVKNSNQVQDSIKFPKLYRDRIDSLLLDSLGYTFDEHLFDRVYSKIALKEG